MLDEKLVEWLKLQKAEGHSNEQLISYLVGQGYDPGEVKETVNSLPASVEQVVLGNVFKFIFQMFFSYISYVFLSGVVILTLAAVLLIILTLNPDYSFGFLEHFKFIFDDSKGDSFSIGEGEIMRIFMLFALGLSVVFFVIKFILDSVFGLDFKFTFKLKMILTFGIVSVLFFISFVMILFLEELDIMLLLVFVIFYILNLFSLGLFFLFDKLSKSLKLQDQ